MSNAISFWGAAHATPATCVTTVGTGTQTCNGNGDGIINTYPSGAANETFRAWQHLVNAGLIAGSYDGVTHGSNTFSATTANAPSGRIGSTLWILGYTGIVSGNPLIFDGDYGHAFLFGGFLADNNPVTAVFKPEEAWNIDTKMDDGRPATGKVVIEAIGGFYGCTDAAVGASATLTANYLLTNTTLKCALEFRQAF